MSRIVMYQAERPPLSTGDWILIAIVLTLVVWGLWRITVLSNKMTIDKRQAHEEFLRSLKYTGHEEFTLKSGDSLQPRWKGRLFTWSSPAGNKFVSIYAESTVNSHTRIIDCNAILMREAIGQLRPFDNVVAYEDWKDLAPKPSMAYHED